MSDLNPKFSKRSGGVDLHEEYLLNNSFILRGDSVTKRIRSYVREVHPDAYVYLSNYEGTSHYSVGISKKNGPFRMIGLDIYFSDELEEIIENIYTLIKTFSNEKESF